MLSNNELIEQLELVNLKLEKMTSAVISLKEKLQEAKEELDNKSNECDWYKSHYTNLHQKVSDAVLTTEESRNREINRNNVQNLKSKF